MAHMKAIKNQKGNTFFYVRKSYRDENKKPTSKNVFAFGHKENAADLLKNFLEDPAKKPEILKPYTAEELKKWLQYVEKKEV